MKRLAATLAILGLVAIIALTRVSWLFNPVQPGAQGARAFEVKPGQSVSAIAIDLAANNLIRSPLAFRYAARSAGLDSQLKAGTYEISPALDVAAIVQKLAMGEVNIATTRITIPEGYTIQQISTLAEVKLGIPRSQFLAATRDSTLHQGDVPGDAPVKQPLEGYLFPATYEFPAGMQPTELIGLMVKRMRVVLSPVVIEQVKAQGLTVHELLTLASIVEKEAQVADERPRIAGVYLNRLRQGMKLDADPATAYGAGKTGDKLTYADLASRDPYNTYVHKGLPPGPIANPGEASIMAVLNAEQHQYLYFVALSDGSGRHVFAATLEEQNHNVAKHIR